MTFFGMEQLARRLWEHFTVKKTWAKSVLEMRRKRGKKECGSRSRRTKRSWSSSSTTGTCTVKVYLCVVHETRECHNEVEAEDEGRSSIAQDTLLESIDFREENYCAEWRSKGCYPLVRGSLLFRLRTTFGSVEHGKKPCTWWCAACGGQNDRRAPNGNLVVQDSTDPRGAHCEYIF